MMETIVQFSNVYLEANETEEVIVGDQRALGSPARYGMQHPEFRR